MDLEMIKKMDEYIIREKCIRLSFVNENQCTVYPQRVVYLDGTLSLIAESIKDKSLVCFPIEFIKSIEFYAEVYHPQFTTLEINDFIINTRIISEKEERLVLKVFNGSKSNLLPPHHYLGNPFVTSNLSGDLIWAASIEMCPAVFEWLYQLKDEVEILDPSYLRKEFKHYCELKNNNLSKKVS